MLTKSSIARAKVADADRSNAAVLASANSAFAWDMFTLLAKKDGNLFFSPFSISEALAMVYAGARGTTASEMEAAFHFDALKDRTHPAFNVLDQALVPSGPSKDDRTFRLAIANSAWAEKTHTFLPAYLDTLAANYGSGLNLTDFAGNPEPARKTINDWVAKQTQDRIKDLLPPKSIDAATRLVLANAIYFKADWAKKFTKDSTSSGKFTLAGGGSVDADFMHQTGGFAYAKSGDMEAVELPYAGNRASMIIILPAPGRLDAVQASLNAREVDGIVGSLKTASLAIAVPKFSFTSEPEIKSPLGALGLKALFDADSADLSGMDGKRDLYVSGIFHKAFVKVDEEGTEAAAATAAVARLTSALPGQTFVVDRPFVFLIRDRETNSTLFVGRVIDPTK